MSMQNALVFIRRARTDSAFGEQLHQISINGNIDLVEQLAKQAQIPCTIEELQQAYRQDWILRWHRRTTAYTQSL